MKRSVPKVNLEELAQFSKLSGPGHILKGANYLYFSIQPTQEKVSYRKLYKDKNLTGFSVLNFKGSIIAYLIVYEGKAHRTTIDRDMMGAALFYSAGPGAHTKSKVAFSDSKFRVLTFSTPAVKDYFFSVKWKSMNPSGSAE
jgi:hypothetical protein